MKNDRKKNKFNNISDKTVIAVLCLLIAAAAVVAFGYRVIVLSSELPGRLVSISDVARDVRYSGYRMSQTQRLDYREMKYGFMDDMQLAQMDYLDRCCEQEQMSEIRALNDLTAMSLRTEDVLAYEKAKQEQEKAAEESKRAAIALEKAKTEKVKLLRLMTSANNPLGSLDTSTNPDTRSNGGKRGKPVYAESHGKSLGEYVVTAYCTCKVCCGVYSGMNRTASGTVPTTNRTLAVDTDYIPFGTKLVIKGQVYVAEDRGGAIKGKRIDMFFFTHKEASQWGKQTLEIFLAK